MNKYQRMFHVYREEAPAEGGTPEGGQTVDWRDNLPESVREWDEVKNSDTAEKFYEQVSNMRSYMGQSIRIPSEEASQEDRQAFYEKLVDKVPNLMPTPDPTNEESMNTVLKALGRPDEASEYAPPELENNPLTDERMGEMKSIAHRYGLSNKQFQGMMKDVIESDMKQMEAMNALTQESRAKLQGEWGDTFEGRVNNLTQFAEKTGAPENLVNLLKANQTDGPTLRWLHNIAESMGEKAVFTSTDKTTPAAVDRQEAAERANELRRKVTSMKPSDPDYQIYLDRMVKYDAMAGGE